MIDKEIVLSDLQVSTASIVNQVSSYDISAFNAPDKEGHWSPGETAEHLLLLDILINRLFNSETTLTIRAVDEKISSIKKIFEKDGMKLISPDMIRPSDSMKNPEGIARKISAERHLLGESIMKMDLSETCLFFIHPDFGEMTRLEWIYFSIYHAQRHLRQMKAGEPG